MSKILTAVAIGAAVAVAVPKLWQLAGERSNTQVHQVNP